MKAEVIIIGAGPAGISCALECIDSKIEPIILERNEEIGGQLSLIPSAVLNFAGGVYENGSALKTGLMSVASEVLNGHVKRGVVVESCDLEKKQLRTNKGLFQADSIVITTGYRFRELPHKFPLTHIPYIFNGAGFDKGQFDGRRVCIIGGGDSALLFALDIVGRAKEVHVVVRSSSYKARPDVVADVESNPRITIHTNTKLERTVGDSCLEAVELVNNEGSYKLHCDNLVVKIGYVPNTELFVGQLDMDDQNHIITDSHGETSVKGVFAAGDIVHDGYDRVAFATGSGVMAAKGVRRVMNHPV